MLRCWREEQGQDPARVQPTTHHRPPPLTLTDSNVGCADSKSNAASTAPSTAPSTTAASLTGRDSSTSTSSNKSASVLTTRSPLLHATWGFPLSLSSMGAGTTAGLGSAVGAGGFRFITSPTGSRFRGAALAMHQMIKATSILEEEGTWSLDTSTGGLFAKDKNKCRIKEEDHNGWP
ncbi:hypothetical protein BKA70DRAFT_1449076 [Coprinopsis sp. MPI-PUGE-AT-0042]|nr:hypothetical protein BKA70DRAFT_1449076 [Coprinopsis sp. MPI-PUGE-AT-0042]